ncbi:MAG: tetratricopeptide repeat protein [Armatimonadetes bacterium]|nr:tetratricopeptide repeat protein [Armatimonadota bacterium]MDW8122027.1 hypothetical protein [Armatimonadota bacterium]
MILFSQGFAFPDGTAILQALSEGRCHPDAIAYLTAKVEAEPNVPSWKAWLGLAHCLNGNWELARQCYQQARSEGAAPSLPFFPPECPSDWLGSLIPVKAQPIGHQTLWQGPFVLWETDIPRDPAHGHRFPWVSPLYQSNGFSARQIVAAFSQREPRRTVMAQWTLAFGHALSWLMARFPTPQSLPVRLWFFSDGDGTIVTRSGNTFLYGLRKSDSMSLWASAAHEAAHHLVPAFGPFPGFHEPYSGGFLGERLFIAWLLDDTDSRRTQEWEWLNRYEKEIIVPEMVSGQQFLLSPLGQQEPTMSSFLGVAIFLERLLSDDFFEFLTQAKGPSWADFLAAIEKGIESRLKGTGLKIRTRAPGATTPIPLLNGLGPIDQPALVYPLWLPKGNYETHLMTEGSGSLELLWNNETIGQVSVTDGASQTPTIRWRNTSAGWRSWRMVWRSGKGRVVQLLFKRLPEGG